MQSLPISELKLVLSKLSREKQIAAIAALKELNREPDERDKDVLRQREKRSEAARIVIPDCVNPQRRERCLQDPELFLKTYFVDRYKRPFGKHHHAMMEAIINRAKYGGRQSIAAPRGCGKSELVKGLQIFLVLAGLSRFILPIAATTQLAGKLYKDFRKKIATRQLLLEDFPEVCSPVRDLDGAPQRAAKQHVAGQLTHIVWETSGYLSLPHVPGSPYGGVKMSYYGLDAAFRGVNIDGDRPDLVIIDDPETRESAKSLMQIEDRERIIDQDVAGLAEEGEELAIVVLTTIQNCYCLSYKITDRDPERGKPAFNGLRFGMIVKWPDTCVDPTDETKLGKWGEYITLRKKDQARGDSHGLNAVAFYLANRGEMDAGHEMLTDHFTPTILDDGTQVTFSALQVAFNKIADTNLAAYRTEYQNDPEKTEDIFQVRVTSHTVPGCEGEMQRAMVEPSVSMLVAGIDVRKTEFHYAKLATTSSRRHRIVDYDVERHGTSETTVEGAEQSILDGLHALNEKWLDNPITDENGDPVGLSLALIDKGWMGSWREDGLKKTWASQPVETFCQQMGLRRWIPAKGAPSYKSPAASIEKAIVGDNWHMNRGVGPDRNCTELIWNAEHYHALVEDLFVSEDPQERFELFYGEGAIHKGHHRLTVHIREGSEDLADMRRRGTASRKQKYRQDHWWDALAMALVAQSVEQWFRDNIKPKVVHRSQYRLQSNSATEIGAR